MLSHVKKQVIISDYTCGAGKKKTREEVMISDTKPIRLFDFFIRQPLSAQKLKNG